MGLHLPNPPPRILVSQHYCLLPAFSSIFHCSLYNTVSSLSSFHVTYSLCHFLPYPSLLSLLYPRTNLKSSMNRHSVLHAVKQFTRAGIQTRRDKATDGTQELNTWSCLHSAHVLVSLKLQRCRCPDYVHILKGTKNASSSALSVYTRILRFKHEGEGEEAGLVMLQYGFSRTESYTTHCYTVFTAAVLFFLS
jgi:hypothetical protein